MRLLLLIAICAFTTTARADIYAIGNSLTVDALPNAISGFGGWHIACNRSLPYIYANPSDVCVPAATWDSALASTQFDYVTVQPYGGTVADNANAISAWMTMQPSATFVVHTSWPALSNFSLTSGQALIDHAEQIISAVQANHPGREILRDKSVDALMAISTDISFNVGPFDFIGEFYRDDLYLTSGSTGAPTDNGEGRYLMHQLLLSAIDEPINPSVNSTIPLGTREYLHGVVANVTAVPEVSAIHLVGAVAIGLLGYRALRR